MAEQREDNIAAFPQGHGGRSGRCPSSTGRASIILALFGLTFVVMLYGVIARGWWMGQMSALFLGMAIVTFFVAKFDAATKMDEHTFVDTFVNGARDLLGVALIIGVARGIVVIMDAGKITDTILHAREAALGGLGNVAFINRDAAHPDAPVVPRAVVVRAGGADDADPRAAGGLRRRRSAAWWSPPISRRTAG